MAGIHFQPSNPRNTSSDVTSAHISSDRLTVLHIFSYLQDKKVGHPLECLQVVLGMGSRRCPWHFGRGIRRPNVLFTCRVDMRGELVVDDDSGDDKDIHPSWKTYFDPHSAQILSHT
jgi:hypothetical protein